MRNCKLCFNPIEDDSIHSLLFKDAKICNKCFRKFKPKLRKFSIDNIDCFYLYDYSEQVQSSLYQFKGCFDIELAEIFTDYFKHYLHFKYFGYTVVPAPSSKESNEKRGFNHVVEMFKNLRLKMERCVYKTKDVKQTEQTALERKNIRDILEISNVNLKNKKVLIVDDVFTTGSTIKAMIELIKTKHPKKIKVLVMSKTIEPKNRVS